MISGVLTEFGKWEAYNCRISISVNPAGNPVEANACLLSYIACARALSFGSAGRAEETETNPTATAPSIDLMEGILILLRY